MNLPSLDTADPAVVVAPTPDDPVATLYAPSNAPPSPPAPELRPNTWERHARPWEQAQRRSPAWWFERADDYERAADGKVGYPESMGRFLAWAFQCRRRGVVLQAIRDRRTVEPMSERRRPFAEVVEGRLRAALAVAELFAVVAPWPEPELDPLWAEYVAACVPWMEGEDLARLAERARVPSWGEVAPLGTT